MLRAYAPFGLFGDILRFGVGLYLTFSWSSLRRDTFDAKSVQSVRGTPPNAPVVFGECSCGVSAERQPFDMCSPISNLSRTAAPAGPRPESPRSCQMEPLNGIVGYGAVQPFKTGVC